MPFAFGLRRFASVQSYSALIASPSVDIIYIATPHSAHFTNAAAALRAGKHVLCEKPLTVNAHEARDLVAIAEESGRFFMEGT